MLINVFTVYEDDSNHVIAFSSEEKAIKQDILQFCSNTHEELIELAEAQVTELSERGFIYLS